MKEINLEEILFNTKFKGLTTKEKDSIRNGLIQYSWEEILEAMKQACLETLELAAENAETTWFVNLSTIVDKQSILNLKDKIK